MNIVGLGIDAVRIERFADAVEEYGVSFLNKIFTVREIDHADKKHGSHGSHIHMAGKFAAKEAVKKALPEGARIGLNWKNIEILNHEDGKPYVVLHGEAKRIQEEFKIREVLVSISHTKELALSNAIGVGDV